MTTQATVEQTGKLAETLLEIKTNEILKSSPHLSREQAFSRAYSAPDSLELRKAERPSSYARLEGTREDDGTAVARSEPVNTLSMSDAEIRASIREAIGDRHYTTDEEAIAAVENSPAERSRRAALRAMVAEARRQGAAVPRGESLTPSKRMAVAKRDNALDALTSAADELRKRDPSLSEFQAFARACKNNPALHKAERSASREALFS